MKYASVLSTGFWLFVIALLVIAAWALLERYKPLWSDRLSNFTSVLVTTLLVTASLCWLAFIFLTIVVP